MLSLKLSRIIAVPFLLPVILALMMAPLLIPVVPFVACLYLSTPPVEQFDPRFSVGDMVVIKAGGETGQIVSSSWWSSPRRYSLDYGVKVLTPEYEDYNRWSIFDFQEYEIELVE